MTGTNTKRVFSVGLLQMRKWLENNRNRRIKTRELQTQQQND